MTNKKKSTTYVSPEIAKVECCSEDDIGEVKSRITTEKKSYIGFKRILTMEYDITSLIKSYKYCKVKLRC